MCYEGGIREFVTWLNKNKEPLHDGVIYMSGQREDSVAEVALQYNDGYNEMILSFANNVHTPEGGMHEEGFKRALTTVLNNYGRKTKMLKDDEKVSGEDLRDFRQAHRRPVRGPDKGKAGQLRNSDSGE